MGIGRVWPALSRRKLLTRAGAASLGAGVGWLAVDDATTGLARAASSTRSPVVTTPPLQPTSRAEAAYAVRLAAANRLRALPRPPQPTNGDEARYPNRLANFTKALPHDALGLVQPAAYDALLRALASGEPSDFNAIPIGGVVPLRNPQAAYAFDLVAPDSHNLAVPPPPAFASAELAGEMVELYWMALLRDTPLDRYDQDATARAAVSELAGMAPFTGGVTTQSLFRGIAANDTVGPYVSQFLLLDIPQGVMPVQQRILTAPERRDYLTTFNEWLAVQNGARRGPLPLTGGRRFIRTGRDLASYVYLDYPTQATMNAALILLGLNAPAGPASPYSRSRNQDGFVTFGPPDVLDLVSRVGDCVLKGAWFQKWLVHRLLRPEEYGGRVHNHKTNAQDAPLHAQVLTSTALQRVRQAQGSYLLSTAYPEGCPIHPAYPSGHATFAGAGVTMLKALFDEQWPLPAPASGGSGLDDGGGGRSYRGPALTVGNELNKLAMNIATGRLFAGIHWRSDAYAGLRLGEAMAIQILTDLKACYNEDVGNFTFTSFDGVRVTI